MNINVYPLMTSGMGNEKEWVILFSHPYQPTLSLRRDRPQTLLMPYRNKVS